MRLHRSLRSPATWFARGLGWITALLLLNFFGVATHAQKGPPVDHGVDFDDVSDRLSPFLHQSLAFGGEGLGGAAWLDFDGDLDLDLFLTNGKTQPNALFRNDGDGRFTDVAAAAGVDDTLGHTGVVAGDIDNDGYPDLFLTGEGFLLFDEQSPTRLYHNNRDGTFSDITATAGVPGAATAMSAAMGDVDNDGLLDLFVASPGHLGFVVPPAESHPNRLYLNNGDLTFTDISAAAGVDDQLGACVVAFSDTDEDGWQDILVGNCNDLDILPTPFHLYRNQGDLTFVDAAAPAGLDRPGFWMSATPGDFDNDGDIDLFSTNIGSTVGAGAGNPALGFHGLWENDGSGDFVDVSVPAGVADLAWDWGSSTADFDNDGDLDLFFAGSFPLVFNVIGPGLGNPGLLLLNEGNGRFAPPVSPAGIDLSSRYTSGVAQGDFDNDGFTDIVVVTETLSAASPGPPVLLHNQGNENNWLTVRPVGTASNAGAVGARIRVRAGPHRLVREVRAGSSFASSESPWPSFGLGRQPVAQVRIDWPGGATELFPGVKANRLATLVQGTGVRLPPRR